MINALVVMTFWAIFLQAIVPPERLPDAVAFLLGAFASLIIQFVKGRFQSQTARFVIAVLLSVVVGVASYVIAKPAETNLVVFVIHVFAYSQFAYNTFWKIIWEGLLKFRKLGAYKP